VQEDLEDTLIGIIKASQQTHGQIEQDDENSCVICMESVADWVLLPCGHICMCRACSQTILSSSNKLCPLCRVQVENTIKTYGVVVQSYNV
jgi:hypothetical protein